jgi:hypothetical protein
MEKIYVLAIHAGIIKKNFDFVKIYTSFFFTAGAEVFVQMLVTITYVIRFIYIF